MALGVSYIEGRAHTSGSNFIMTGNKGSYDYDIESNLREEDQDFIAMSHTVVPELIEEILRLRKLLDDNAVVY